jgi:hypothetical protein
MIWLTKLVAEAATFREARQPRTFTSNSTPFAPAPPAGHDDAYKVGVLSRAPRSV